MKVHTATTLTVHVSIDIGVGVPHHLVHSIHIHIHVHVHVGGTHVGIGITLLTRCGCPSLIFIPCHLHLLLLRGSLSCGCRSIIAVVVVVVVAVVMNVVIGRSHSFIGHSSLGWMMARCGCGPRYGRRPRPRSRCRSMEVLEIGGHFEGWHTGSFSGSILTLEIGGSSLRLECEVIDGHGGCRVGVGVRVGIGGIGCGSIGIGRGCNAGLHGRKILAFALGSSGIR